MGPAASKLEDLRPSVAQFPACTPETAALQSDQLMGALSLLPEAPDANGSLQQQARACC